MSTIDDTQPTTETTNKEYTMSAEDFMRQQYITLRQEISEGKARIFRLLVLGTLLVPLAGFAASEFHSVYASSSMPFVVLVLMFAFVLEQNTIVRCGRYLKEHVEPHIQGVVTWEKWLESNNRIREVDRFFVGSFIFIFFIFYAIAVATALKGISDQWYDHYIYAGIGYLVGGIWFIIVLFRHWHYCTTTKP
jgi:hypothetical protein